MADNIPSWYVQQFSTNIQLLLQQHGSRLRSAVMSGTHVGSQASPVDQINAITANKVVARFASMPRTDALLARRWAFPVDYDVAQLIDSFDKLRLITDPTGHYVENAMYALGRAQDAEIINNFFGAAKTGVDAGSTTNFGSTVYSGTGSSAGASVVGVQTGGSASSSLNVAKLRAAKMILMQNEVDIGRDPIYCAITAKQHDALLQEVQVIDRDFNGDMPVLQEGRIARFLGIDFIHTELLQTGTDDQSGAGSTQVPIWAKSGMYLGLWNDLQTVVSQRNDLQGLPWQAYCKGSFGATRLDENRVVKVWCV